MNPPLPISLLSQPNGLSTSALTSIPGPAAPVLLKQEIIRIPIVNLETILGIIKKENRTGSLTIHFSQGKAGGYAEFKQESKSK